MEVRQQKKTSKIAPYLPAIGMVMAICFFIIAWVVAGPITKSVIERNAGVGRGLAAQLYMLGFVKQLKNIGWIDQDISADFFVLKTVIALIGFLILTGVGGVIVGIAAPKQKGTTKDAALKKERQGMLAEKKAQKRRQDKMRRMNRQ